MKTGELSLQENLEKAWGRSYSCLDSGQHSRSEPKLQMGYSCIPASLICMRRGQILNFLLIQDRYVFTHCCNLKYHGQPIKFYPKRNTYVSGIHGLTNITKLKHCLWFSSYELIANMQSWFRFWDKQGNAKRVSPQAAENLFHFIFRHKPARATGNLISQHPQPAASLFHCLTSCIHLKETNCLNICFHFIFMNPLGKPFPTKMFFYIMFN